jgi:hypothetical protein
MEPTEVLMSVIIGVDPHKATHTAVAIDRSEAELARARVRATNTQVPQLLRWAEPLGDRTWAIESAGGLGSLLAQQLVAAGEIVLDVPATLASRIRVLGTAGPTRTTRTTRCRWRSRRYGPPRYVRCAHRSRPGAAAPGEAQHRHRKAPHPGCVPSS